jgi:hypothetical protein
MISLDSPEWANLKHAYGNASNIPDLLRQLNTFPSSEGTSEPWFSIWSTLAHQGDVYSASFAAVPHVVQILATAPSKASYEYFQFPAWIEICRQKLQLPVPDALAVDYFQALKMLAPLVGAVAVRDWNSDFLRAAMSALAISKGFPSIGEAAQELDMVCE